MEKKQLFHTIKNENGSVLIIAVLILMALTIIGISAMSTSDIDVRISANDKFHKLAFFASDAGISYVAVNPDLYGPSNTTIGNQLTFPDTNNANATYQLSNQVQVNGNVSYLGKSQLPPALGYSAGNVLAVNYEIESNGTGPSNGANTVHAGFYRIGL